MTHSRSKTARQSPNESRRCTTCEGREHGYERFGPKKRNLKLIILLFVSGVRHDTVNERLTTLAYFLCRQGDYIRKGFVVIRSRERPQHVLQQRLDTKSSVQVDTLETWRYRKNLVPVFSLALGHRCVGTARFAHSMLSEPVLLWGNTPAVLCRCLCLGCAFLVQAAAPPHVVPFCSSYSKISYLTLKKCGEYGRSTVATKTHGGFSSSKHDLARSVRVLLNSFWLRQQKLNKSKLKFQNLKICIFPRFGRSMSVCRYVLK